MCMCMQRLYYDFNAVFFLLAVGSVHWISDWYHVWNLFFSPLLLHSVWQLIFVEYMFLIWCLFCAASMAATCKECSKYVHYICVVWKCAMVFRLCLFLQICVATVRRFWHATARIHRVCFLSISIRLYPASQVAPHSKYFPFLAYLAFKSSK